MKRLALAVAAAVLLVACRDQQPLQPPARVGPAALIVDGAHGGNAAFFFLPPLVPDPSGSPNFNAATFNPNLAPVVEVCVLPGDPGTATVACGDHPQLVFGPTPLALDGSSQQYRVNWDTKSPAPLDASKFYRMTVRGARGGTPLGTLDLDPVDQGVKNLRTGDVVQFQDGRTLPIRVRIQQGAFGATNPDHVEQVVPSHITTPFLDVTTNTGFAGARFFDGWLPVGFDQVVVIIERVPVNDAAGGTSCLRSDLSELEGCYRFRTDPDLHGLGLEGADLPFAIPVIAGVCFEISGVVGNPELAPPYGMNRREEVEGVLAGPIVTLEDVPAPFLNCGTFTRTPPPSVLGVIRSGQLRELPGAAWHALLRGVARVVQPRALNAVDLGAGGSTDGFSRFGWLRSATMTKVLTTDNQIGTPGSRLPADPTVCLKFTHHSEPQPLVNEPVTFTVTTGGGTVDGGSSTTAHTGEDGCAHVAWVLGRSTTPGGNTLTATALADGSPQTFTATGLVAAFTSLEAGERQACAIASNRVAYCWGSDAVGQLGDGGASDRIVPTPVSGDLAFTGISSTFEHTCALAPNGQVSCWGRNDSGQLGDGTSVNRATPVAVSGDFTFAAVSTGGLHTCALTSSGAAYCWGANSRGQLGTGNTLSSSVPVPVSGGLVFTTISAGFFHTCGLTEGGAAFCWGDASLGALGKGDNTPQLCDIARCTAPVPVSGELAFTAITSGALYTCGLTGEGAAFCWGNNASGQLGTGPDLSARLVPTPVSGELRFVALAADNQNDIFGHTCGITAANAAYCWGENVAGELGAPTSETCPGIGANPPHPCARSPVGVSGGLLLRMIAAGIDHTCAITTSGQAYCWGGNSHGQLGNGTTTASSTPVLVSGQVPPTP